jgi:hypothetical protein
LWALTWVTTASAQDAVNATRAPIKRWAIISDVPVTLEGVHDLVFAELANSDLELVERSDLATLYDEKAVQALASGQASERIQVGTFLQADGLIIMSKVSPSKPDVPATGKVTICECRQGVRLGSLNFDLNKSALHATELTTAIIDVCKQFADGVQTVVGISPIACRNIQHDFDHLQRQYYDYLTSELLLSPGVALLEFQEARSLLQDFNAGTDVSSRVIPAFVEADYRVEDTTTPPTVQILVSITTGNAIEKIESGNLPLGEAGNWITHELADKILHHTKIEPRSLSLELQKETLIKRAEYFSSLGDRSHAIQCREALMLVEPLNVAQRLQLIEEIQRNTPLAQQPTPPKPPFAGPSRANRDERIGEQTIRLLLVLDHFSFLVENKLIDRGLAIERLAGMENGMPHTISDGPNAMAEYLFASKATQKLLDTVIAVNRRFVLEVAPKIPTLPLDRELTPEENIRELLKLQDSIMLRVHADVLLNGGTIASLEYLTKAVRQVVSEELPTSPIITSILNICENNYRLSVAPLKADPKIPFQREEAIFGPPLPEFIQLLAQMRQSQHTHLQLYGQLISIEIGRLQGTDSPQSLLGKLDALILQAESRPFANITDIYGTYLDGVLRSAKRMRSELSPRPQPEPPKPRIETTSLGRMKFEKLTLDFASRGLGSPNFQWTNCDGRFDMLANSQRVALLTAQDHLETIIDKSMPGQNPIDQCRWDGKQFWLVLQGGGIEVYDTRGARRMQIDRESGLPAHDQDLQLFPIGTDRALAYGRHGADQRCWLAIIDTDPDATKATINVFFEARRSLDPLARYTAKQLVEMERDITLTFQPTWVSLCRQPEARLVFMGRSQKTYPLVIDLASHKVHLSTDLGKTGAEPPRKPITHSMVVSGKQIFKSYRTGVAQFQWTRGTTETKLVTEKFIGGKQIPEWFDENPTLLEHGAWIYKPGAVWYRFRPDTLAIERLVPSKLPQEWSQLECMVSSQFGIVGWNAPNPDSPNASPTFYRIQIQED